MTSLELNPEGPGRGEAFVTVNPGVRYQEILGFGGSFTESSVDVLSEMSVERQEEIINAYFRKISEIKLD